MSAAEDCIRGTGWFESDGQAHAEKVAASIVAALRDDSGALQDLIGVPQFWHEMILEDAYAKRDAERARAEKAEAENRDFFMRMSGAEQELSDLKDVIRSVMCDGEPLITVDEAGRVWRVEQVHPAQNDAPTHERYYRLVPIEDQS